MQTQSLLQTGACTRTPKAFPSVSNRTAIAATTRLPASTINRRRSGTQGQVFDVVLSSGFLAFAHHSGFLQAVENAGLEVAGVMGTSAGALAGSLYCAGYTPRQVATELSRVPPINYLKPSGQPWDGGLLSFDGVIARLQELLPPTFEDLEREFAVGVVDAQGRYMLLDSGPLPEAVAASAAIPLLFQGVRVPGLGRRNPCKDGGVVDRVGLKGWRERRRCKLGRGSKGRVPPCLVHVIERSSQFSGSDDVAAAGESNITTVYSPKSGVSLLNLGDFQTALDASIERATPQLEKLKDASRPAFNRWSWPWGG